MRNLAGGSPSVDGMLMTLAVGQGLKTDTSSLLEPDIELTEMLSRQSRIFAWSKTAENSSLQGAGNLMKFVCYFLSSV